MFRGTIPQTSTIKSLKTRCDTITPVINIAFIFTSLFLIAQIIYWIVLFTKPSCAFSCDVFKSGEDIVAISRYAKQGTMVIVNQKISESVVTSPKAFYILNYFRKVLCQGLVAVLLYYTKELFGTVARYCTPFQESVVQYFYSSGWITILWGVIINVFYPIIAEFLGFGKYSITFFDFRTIMLGGILLSFSYIFGYGMTLQIESDGTL